MPVIRSSSKAARNANISEEIRTMKARGGGAISKKKIKQAVAIGYSEQRQAKKKGL